jgi:hypothetical protein
MPNYPRKAQAPTTKLKPEIDLSKLKKYTVIGWGVIALDAEVSSDEINRCNRQKLKTL